MTNHLKDNFPCQQFPGDISEGNYLWGNCPGVIIRGQSSRGQLFGDRFSSEAIILGAIILGHNCPGAIIWGAIIQGVVARWAIIQGQFSSGTIVQTPSFTFPEKKRLRAGETSEPTTTCSANEYLE